MVANEANVMIGTIVHHCDAFQDPINNHGKEVSDENDDSEEKQDTQNNPSVFEKGSTAPVKFQFLDTNNTLLVATTALCTRSTYLNRKSLQHGQAV